MSPERIVDLAMALYEASRVADEGPPPWQLPSRYHRRREAQCRLLEACALVAGNVDAAAEWREEASAEAALAAEWWEKERPVMYEIHDTRGGRYVPAQYASDALAESVRADLLRHFGSDSEWRERLVVRPVRAGHAAAQ